MIALTAFIVAVASPPPLPPLDGVTPGATVKWSGPNPSVLRGYFPERADREGASGQVVLACTLDSKKKVQDCAVLLDTKPSYSFAEGLFRAAKDIVIDPVEAMSPGDLIVVNANMTEPLSAGEIEVRRASAGPLSIPGVENPSLGPPLKWKAVDGSTKESLDINKFYPERSYRNSQSGVVKMACVLGATKSLNACRMLEYTPVGWEFEVSAARITSFVLINDGEQTLDGEMVAVTVKFSYGPLVGNLNHDLGQTKVAMEVRPVLSKLAVKMGAPPSLQTPIAGP